MVAKRKADTRAAARVKKDLAREQARLRAALDRKLDQLHALRREGASSWDRQWEIVGDILWAEPPLWRGAFKSESELIRKELPGETMRSARRNAIVAAAFTPRDIEQRGPSVLEEIALYLQERAGAKRPPRAVDLDRVAVEIPKKGGGTSRVSGRVVELAQVRAARRAVRGEGGAKRSSAKERAIRSAIAGSEDLAGTTVRVTGDVATIRNVPIAALGSLAAALKKVRIPE